MSFPNAIESIIVKLSGDKDDDYIISNIKRIFIPKGLKLYGIFRERESIGNQWVNRFRYTLAFIKD